MPHALNVLYVLAALGSLRNELLNALLLLDIVKKAWRRPPPFADDLISTAAILLEIKNFSKTF